MSKTYLDIINITLRDLNELPMSLTEFNSPRGIQAAVKEMVNRAYADILNHSKEWPFLNTTDPVLLTANTVAGTNEYTFPINVDHVDWDSFFIKLTGGNHTGSLDAIDIDFYTKHLKKNEQLLPEGSFPQYVYRLKNNRGFGVTPIPDSDDYVITYAAWVEPTLLVASDDEIVIPERYYNVLIARTRYYLWLFRDNPQHANFAAMEYENSLRQMHRDLVEKQSIKMVAV